MSNIEAHGKPISAKMYLHDPSLTILRDVLLQSFAAFRLQATQKNKHIFAQELLTEKLRCVLRAVILLKTESDA